MAAVDTPQPTGNNNNNSFILKNNAISVNILKTKGREATAASTNVVIIAQVFAVALRISLCSTVSTYRKMMRMMMMKYKPDINSDFNDVCIGVLDGEL